MDHKHPCVALIDGHPIPVLEFGTAITEKVTTGSLA
jgi:hypothetical protein